MAGRALLANLEKSKWNLRRFCDELSLRGFDTLDELFDGQDDPAAKQTALVAWIRLPTWAAQPSSSGKAARQALTRTDRLSPFDRAQPSHYLEYQDGDEPIFDGRYGEIGGQTLAAPIEIYHPVFAAFVANVKNESLDVPEDVVRSTASLMVSISRITTSDAPRSGQVLSDLSNLISATIVDAPNISWATLAIVEEKGELGFDGEPSVQGSFAYADFWQGRDQAALTAACFCPSFIIALAGPCLTVCGAIFTTGPIIQRLTDYIWLGHSRTIDDRRTLALARVFYALRFAISSLRAYYDELDVSARNSDDGLNRFFPLATSFPQPHDESSGEGGMLRVRFRYLRPLNGPCPSRRATAAMARRLLVVKFAERYGDAAHRLLAERGFAPALLYCGPIWPEGASDEATTTPKCNMSKMKMVVLEVLHGQDFVHGDIRLPNIVIATPTRSGGVGDEDKDTDKDFGQRTKIVDFDWAGEEGVVRYPLHLANAGWVEGVQDYGLIRAAHDRGMADKL